MLFTLRLIPLSVMIMTMIYSEDSFSKRYEQRTRTVAIGDIHADGYALETILKGMNLIDADENWIGGETHLIFLGDILDRGLSSRKALDLLIKVEMDALKAGGLVTAILGNHEFMVVKGDLRYFARRDALNYVDVTQKPMGLRNTVVNAFSSHTKYGKWIDRLPTMISVGNTLFTHAGVESWIMNNSIEKVNSIVKRWMGFYRGVFSQPPAHTAWAIGPTGPLWTRSVAYGEVDSTDYSKWLSKAGFERVIVGHSILEEGVPLVQTEKYGQKLVMIDTGISSAIGGRLSAIEWIKGQPIRTHLFDRPQPPQGFTEESLKFNSENGGDGIDVIKPQPVTISL